ncbi:cation:proton antiporter, partial [bacterium]|nr:cation:proton antiporter [bacterium]
MHSLISIIIIAVAVSTVLNVLLKRINIPTVIGYIFTGVALGSLFKIHVHGNEPLEHLGEFGIVFLMFTIGLEFSVDHLKSMKKEVFSFGALQVLVTGACMALIAITLFGIDVKTATIIGLGLALSSTAIVLKLLNETGQMNSVPGRNSVGILIFQDIAVIPILLMITIFTSNEGNTTQLLLKTALNAVITLGILIGVGRYVLNYIFKTVSDANSKEIFMGLVFFVVIGASFIAHHFGFSYSLGAFIAGMMIADTIHKYQVEADLIPFRDILLGVFFVTVGLQIELNIIANHILTILALGGAIML